MSHLFISYSHDDLIHLADFVDKLKQAGFKDDGENKDIWIDKSGIEGGDEWRNEIDIALEESFAVVILLTKNSIKSRFVLYEWAWALGNEIRVIPVLVEDINSRNLPKKFKHPLYERKQYKNWNVLSDQEYVINQLKDLKQLSPLDVFLGMAISEIILPTRILSYFVVWCYPYAYPKHVVSHADFYYLLGNAVYETHTCYTQKLRDFWLDNSSAFNRKQKRLYANLIPKLTELWDLLRDLYFVAQTNFQTREDEKSISERINELYNFQQELDKTIMSLNVHSLPIFEGFRSDLRNISSRSYSQDRLRVMKAFSPTFDLALKSLSKEEREKVEQVIELAIRDLPYV